MNIKKIITGGQSGIDEIGLRFAWDYSIPTGGTAPKDYKIQLPNGGIANNLLLKDKYRLKESYSSDYPVRTKANVQEADATILFGNDKSRGALLTINTCVAHKKPILINPRIELLQDWLKFHGFKIINIAGNRLSNNNCELMIDTYLKLKAAIAPEKMSFYQDWLQQLKPGDIVYMQDICKQECYYYPAQVVQPGIIFIGPWLQKAEYTNKGLVTKQDSKWQITFADKETKINSVKDSWFKKYSKILDNLSEYREQIS